MAAAAAADKGLHLPGGKAQSFTWRVTDGAKYQWDISAHGQVSDGTNDAYDGGMRLSVNGSNWSHSGNGRRSKDGHEVEIGPWTRGSLRIWRRIYVDPKVGYCRWIDIFENTSASTEQVRLKYYTNIGGSVDTTYTTSGKAALTDADWGLITGQSSGGSRPALVHIFASRSARVRPSLRWQLNSDSLYYDLAVKIPAKSPVAVCLFEAQRRPYAEAQKFLKEFSVERELRKVPAELRRILLNMGGAMLTLGTLELPRNEERDLVVKRNGDELLGTLLGERYLVETGLYGRLDVPAAEVVGFRVPVEGEPYVQLGLIDGQVVAGKLLADSVELRLPDGNRQTLAIGDINTAAYRLSPERPEDIEAGRPMAILRSGQRLFFRAADLDATFRTEYGDLALSPANLRMVHLDTPDGGLHRAEFRNGSVLSGLLLADRLSLALDLGRTLTCPRHLVERFEFPGEAPPERPLAELTLRNEDMLRGRIVEEQIEVVTPGGRNTFRPARIAEIERVEGGPMGVVHMKLHDGTTISGRLAEETLRFRVEPGPELPVFVGHIDRLTCPKGVHDPSKPPSTQPASTQPTTRPTTRRVAAHPAGGREAADAAVEAQRKRLLAQRERLAAQIEEMAKLRAEVSKKANGPNPAFDKAMAEFAAREQALHKEVGAIDAKLRQLQDE